MQRLDDDRILLEIADDGVGLKADYDIHRSKTMGMELIDSLNQQIDGTMTVENRDGLYISIIFT